MKKKLGISLYRLQAMAMSYFLSGLTITSTDFLILRAAKRCVSPRPLR